jgi:hypothetical protein
MEEIFYVYGLFEIGTENILYIGKGKNDRSKKHIPLLLDNKHTNPKLQNKFNSLVSNNSSLEDRILANNLTEYRAFEIEKQLIEFYGLKNLCNLTRGGEGGDCLTNNPNRVDIIQKSARSRAGKKRDPKIIEKIKVKREKWRNSEEYQIYLKKMSSERIGQNNPMYGKTETEEHKKERMKNMLSKPRWNKGLTKDDDPRIAKLGHRKGKLPHNAKNIKVIDINTGDILSFDSIKLFQEHIKNTLKKCNNRKLFKLLKKEEEVYERWKLME